MTTIRVSVNNSGNETDNYSDSPALSSNGRYVVYRSEANNLVDNDNNSSGDIFLYDTQTQQTSRVSADSNGEEANGSSVLTTISNDGRYIAYSSEATNLVSGDSNGLSDIFLYDSVSLQTTRISVDSNGNQTTGGLYGSYSPSISGDGNKIAYTSYATNLVAEDSNNRRDIFLYDNTTKQTTRISVSSNGTQASGGSDSAIVSASGRYVAYESDASNLVSGDTNGKRDIFLYDTLTKQTTRINVDNNGTQANKSSTLSSISSDGRYVAYSSNATNLVQGDSNGVSDIFVYDTLTKQTTRVSVDSNGLQATGASYSPSISGDGLYVAYSSEASNLVPGDTNGTRDIFVYDMVSKKTRRFSVDSKGLQTKGGDYGSYAPIISSDGKFVAYVSDGTNLVTDDGNNQDDIFLTNVDFNPPNEISLNTNSYSVSENGTFVTPIIITRANPDNTVVTATLNFTSDSATSPQDYSASAITVTFSATETSKTVTVPIVNDSIYEGNENFQLSLSASGYVGDINTANLTILDNDVLKVGSNFRASVSSNGTQANDNSDAPKLSSDLLRSAGGDRRYVVFTSNADNLVANDTNGLTDIFLYDIQTQQTNRINVTSNGLEAKGGNFGSDSPTISSDGRYVAYSSDASNLVSGDTNQASDILLYDTTTKQTTRISVNNKALQVNYDSITPSFSGNGRYIAYVSNATNLVAGDNNGLSDIFLYDTVAKNTSRISVDNNGIEAVGGDLGSDSPTISSDGRYVAYGSDATNLVTGDTNSKPDIFVYDGLTKKTTRVSVDSTGKQATGGENGSNSPSISSNGRYIAYASDANNLTSADNNNLQDIFVYDTVSKRNNRVSLGSNGVEANGASYAPTLSSDGRYVAYTSEATNLVTGDTNGKADVFVYDILTQKTTRVSSDGNGSQASGDSRFASISGDGSYIAYVSDATNLVGGDSANKSDIFIKYWNDPALNPSTVAFDRNSFSVNENGTAVLPIAVTRADKINTPVSVTVTLSNGSATSPADYSNSPITVSFASGQTSQTITIPIVNDGLIEQNETINLTLSNPTGGGTLGGQKTAVLTILDNDKTTGINQTGSSGNDTLTGGSGNDFLTAEAGNDNINGTNGNDTLIGGSGNDFLTGGAGNDSLTGGLGRDRFLFNSPTDRSDTVSDFNVIDDLIQVKATGFAGGLKAGEAIASNQFVMGSTSNSSSSRFIYNKTTGGLFFDVDGTGATSQVLLASLSPNLALTNQDIWCF